jgi:hypothetical protein
MNWSRLFPPGQEYDGPRSPFYFLILVAVTSTVRSLVHMFFADGGAGVIAGIDVGVAGGTNIIAMFGQWGASQLILALIYWLVILRYRSLTPLMLAVIVLEQSLRLGIGQIKPLEIAAPPPGALGSELLLPIAVVAWVWSFWPKPKAETTPQSKVMKSKKKK